MITRTIRNYLILVGRTLLWVPLFFLGSAQADVTYDGIYQWSPGNFLSLHQDGTQMIATIYFTNDGNYSFPGTNGGGVLPVPQLDLFDLMSGPVTGSTAHIDGTRFHRACNVAYDFKFNSDATITVTRIGVSNTPTANSAGISCSSIVGMEAATIIVPKIRFAPNLAPVANAGSAQNVVTGTLVTLDGSASSDGNGKTLTYFWSIVSAPNFIFPNISNITSIHPTFIADSAGEYVIKLLVDNGQTYSESTVTVTAASAQQGTTYEIESNDTQSNANGISINSTIVGHLMNASDVDWYQINLSAGLNHLDIRTQISNNNEILNVSIFSPGLVAYSDDLFSLQTGKTGIANGVIFAQTTGEYLIRVRTPSSAPSLLYSGNYYISITR